jgi:molybdopterin synthase catalytic subunit
MIDIRVQAGDFDPGRQLARLGELKKTAVTGFTGHIETDEDVEHVWIDHHAGLARSELQAIAEEAEARWSLAAIILIHRHGRIAPGERALFVGVAAPDVDQALAACAWLVAQIRTRAPFWRKDVLADGTGRWR